MLKFTQALAFVTVLIATMVAATPRANAAQVVSCVGDYIVLGPWAIPYYPPDTYYAEIIQNECTLDDGSTCSYNYTESWQLINGTWQQTNSSLYNDTCPFPF